MSACVFRIIFTCESSAWPISTDSVPTEGSELKLTCGNYFVALRLEVVATTELLWFR